MGRIVPSNVNDSRFNAPADGSTSPEWSGGEGLLADLSIPVDEAVRVGVRDLLRDLWLSTCYCASCGGCPG
jgi:hypothetical protein